MPPTHAGHHQQICRAIVNATRPTFHRSHPDLPVQQSGARQVDQLMHQLVDFATYRYHNEPEYHARVELLTDAFHLLERHTPQTDDEKSPRDHAFRAMAVLPMLDEVYPPAPQPPHRSRPW